MLKPIVEDNLNDIKIITNKVRHFDVIIVGAGPAGASCSIALKDSNLSVLLVDKETFPRDKICGDLIGGRSINILNKYVPELVKEIRSFGMKGFNATTRIFINNHKPFNLYWKNESYCIKRIDFDELLLTYALKNCKTLTFKSNFKIDDVIKERDKITIGNKSENIYFSADIIVAADGSQSFLAKQLIDLHLDPSNFSAAVRAYYSNIDGILPNQSEVHIYKEHMPGYLWIFPLGNNISNVGFGMLSEEISKRKINLRNSLNEIISLNPELRKRFEGAKMETSVKGFGLALGSRRVKLFGNNFLLIGDAASLIDPKSGDGISNAIESGFISANTIIKAHEINDFSEESLKKYKTDLYKKIGNELFISTIILRIITYMPSFVRIFPIILRNKLLFPFAKRFL